MEDEIERCRAMQRECAQYVATHQHGTDCPLNCEVCGAIMAIGDWLMEEVLMSNLKIHPRGRPVCEARFDISSAILAAIRKYELTYVEVLSILAQESLTWSGLAVQDERYPEVTSSIQGQTNERL